MKKPILFLLASLAALSACNSPKDQNPSANSRPLVSELDTFYLGNRLVTVTPAGSEDISSDPLFHSETAKDENLQGSSEVKRHGDSLIFLLPSGKTACLVNDTVVSDAMVFYYFAGLLPGLDHYLVRASHYEWRSHLLVHRRSGQLTEIVGEPVLSPDGQHFMCINCDLVAGFEFNGLELFRNGEKPKKLATRYLGKWGPLKAKWLDNNSLLVEGCTIDTLKEELKERVQYLKLSMQ